MTLLATPTKLPDSHKVPEKRSGIHYCMQSFTMMLLLACLLLILPTTTNASCLPIDEAPTLREQFNSSELVARLQLKDPPETIKLPCGVLVFDESQVAYVIVDEFPAYEIIELFKGQAPEGDIPIVWWTDTGYRTSIPYYITDDPDGFLGVMDGFRTCQNDTSFWLYEEDYEPLPYEMGSCSYSNRPWSSVSDDDQEWLRQQAVSGGGTNTVSPTPTSTPPVVPVEPEPSEPTPQPSLELMFEPSSIPIPVLEQPIVPTEVPVESSSLVPASTPPVVPVEPEPSEPTPQPSLQFMVEPSSIPIPILEQSIMPTDESSIDSSLVPSTTEASDTVSIVPSTTSTELPTGIAEASLGTGEEDTSSARRIVTGVLLMLMSSLLAVMTVVVMY